MDQQELLEMAQAEFSKISGLDMFLFGFSPLPGSESGLPVNFVIGSNADYDELETVSEQVLSKARESGLFLGAVFLATAPSASARSISSR